MVPFRGSLTLTFSKSRNSSYLYTGDGELIFVGDSSRVCVFCALKSNVLPIKASLLPEAFQLEISTFELDVMAELFQSYKRVRPGVLSFEGNENHSENSLNYNLKCGSKREWEIVEGLLPDAIVIIEQDEFY